MKTKHILTALALPTMFAACTADDIVSENNAMQQAERAKLSKDFVLNVNNGVDSRYAVEGTTGLKFNFEEGDLIGANLIDAYAPGINFVTGEPASFDPEDPSTWQIVSTVAPALPFEMKGDIWKSAGELGVGNYLFTNPYNPEDKGRAAAKYELPIVVQYDSKNPNAHIEAYNKAVSAEVLTEDETEANISLKNLFTYPKIVVNFPSNAEVTKVTKVILKREGKFIYKGALNHQDIVKMFNEDVIEAWLDLPANKDKTVEDYWAEKTTSHFVIDGTEATADAETGVKFAEVLETPAFIYEMNENLVANSFEVRLMLPSISDLTAINHKAVADDPDTQADETVNRSADAITMFICTDNGNFKFDLTDLASYTFKGTTLIDQKKVALARNKSNTLNVNKDVLSKATAGEVDELLSGNLVSTAADWNALVEKYGDLKKYAKDYTAADQEDLIVKILGNKFALTSDLKMPEVAEFIIETDVEVKGDVALKNITVRKATGATANPKVTVKEGSTLTTDQTLVAPVVNVEEGAELVFAAAYDKKNKLVAYTGVTTVNNEGIVTVPAGVEATFALNNVKKASELNVGEAAATRAAAVAKANLNGGYNYGLINNYGEINVKAEFENKYPTAKNGNIVTGYEQDKENNNEWNGFPTILNEGTFNAEKTVKNSGVFKNNNTLSSDFTNGNFNNLYELYIAAGKSTYIDANSGTIYLSEKNPTDFVIHGKMNGAGYSSLGKIKYTATATELASLDLSGSPVTYLIANGNVNLVKTYAYTASGTTTVYPLPVLEVNGGDVKIAGSTATAGAPAKVTKLLVASGKAAISTVINSVTSIEVVKNASLEIVEGSGELTIASHKNITFTGTLDTEAGDVAGLLKVNGKMTTSDEYDTTSVPTSELAKNIELGKGVSITCNSNATSKKTASMKAAVELWASKWYSLKSYGCYDNNPYDVNKFIAAMTRWENTSANIDGSTTVTYASVVAAVKTNFGIDGTTDKTWNDKMFKADEVTPIDNFTSAVETYLKTIKYTDGDDEFTGAAAAAELFITEAGAFKNVPSMTQDATYYASQAETYDVVRKTLTSQYNATDNESAQLAATAWLLTDAKLSTAMAKVEASKYWFVWKDCDMEALVDIWAYYSVSGKAQYVNGDCSYGATDPRTSAHVIKWAKYIKDLSAAELATMGGIYKEAQDLLKDYTYQDLDKKYSGFSASQVSILVNKGEVSLVFGTPNAN